MHSPEASIDSNGIGLFGARDGHLQRQGRPDRGPALRSRIERRAPQHLLLAGDRAGQRRRRRAVVRTTCRRSLRSAIASTRSTPPMLSAARGYKAGGFNPAALPGSEAYGEEHAWHVEAGVEVDAGRRQGRGQRGGVLHRLGRPAAERAEPVRAGPVLHRQRRQRAQQRRRVRRHRAAARRRSICSRRSDSRARSSLTARWRTAWTSPTTTCPTRRTTRRLFGGQMDARHHVDDQRLRARGSGADRRVRLRRRQHAKARTRIRS